MIEIESKLNNIIADLDNLKQKVGRQDRHIEELVTKEDLRQEVEKEVEKIIKPRKEEPFSAWWGNTGLAWTIAFVVMVMMVLGLISLMNYKGNEGYYDREIRTDR